MTGTILVTVATGETVRIIPHPSGVRGMPPLELTGDCTLRVAPAEAERLYALGKILDPATGMAKPPAAPDFGRRPTISLAGGPMQPADEPGWQIESRAAERVELERIRVTDNLEIDRRNALVRPHHAAGPVLGWPQPSPNQS
jgi:hypothetical protein